jgi:hypothetical protein
VLARGPLPVRGVAFLANGFFLLVGDRQVLELDEVVQLDEKAEVVFLRLVPLMGG